MKSEENLDFFASMASEPVEQSSRSRSENGRILSLNNSISIFSMLHFLPKANLTSKEFLILPILSGFNSVQYDCLTLISSENLKLSFILFVYSLFFHCRNLQSIGISMSVSRSLRITCLSTDHSMDSSVSHR